MLRIAHRLLFGTALGAVTSLWVALLARFIPGRRLISYVALAAVPAHCAHLAHAMSHHDSDPARAHAAAAIADGYVVATILLLMLKVIGTPPRARAAKRYPPGPETAEHTSPNP